MTKQTARERRRERRFKAGMSLLAGAKFDGQRVCLDGGQPWFLGDVSLQVFHAVVERLLGLSDEQLFADVVAIPNEMRELGTACVQMSEWHRTAAEACSILKARILCCVAKDIKRLTA